MASLVLSSQVLVLVLLHLLNGSPAVQTADPLSVGLHCLQTVWFCNTPIREYGDVTETNICRSKIPSHIYTKHQYRQESEYESTWCVIHSNI